MNDVMLSFIGKTLVDVKASDTDIKFEFSDGGIARMHHYQDCCETVTVEDVCGDWDDLLNSPLLQSEEVSGDSDTVRPELFVSEISKTDDPYMDESSTWTFYRMATIKGSVVIRWLGTSNGYYSEAVCVESVR